MNALLTENGCVDLRGLIAALKVLNCCTYDYDRTNYMSMSCCAGRSNSGGIAPRHYETMMVWEGLNRG